MLLTLQKWFNGKQEYYTGVALYSQLMHHDARLLELFKKGPTEFTRKKLGEELLSHYTRLNAQKALESQGSLLGVKAVKMKSSGEIPSENGVENKNPELYRVCKEKADQLYKETMNLRAELFALGRPDDYTDLNTPDKIEQRSKLAIDIVTKYQQVSKLYDEADHVRIYGKLPYQEAAEENEYDALPDHLVKQTLDNLRKNYNKMKKRPQTPERTSLLQKHKANIEKLEARWHLLKPEK